MAFLTLLRSRRQVLDSCMFFARRGIFLVTKGKGDIAPAGVADDLGLYYYVPLLINWLNCSLEQGIQTFLFLLLLLSGFFSLAGLWGQCVSRVGYLLCGFGVWFLVFLASDICDVYLASFLAASFIPWWILHSKKMDGLFWFWTMLIGLCCGILHTIRSFSGLPTIVFIVISILLSKCFSNRNKAIVLGALLCAYTVPILHMKQVIQQRDAYLVEHNPLYNRPNSQHVFWHSIYIGLGFIHNPFGPYYDDACGGKKGRELGALYPSQKYEQAMKKEIFQFIQKNKFYIISLFFAKLGVLLAYFLIFSNIGIVCMWYYPRPWKEQLAWFCAIVISAIPSLLVVPIISYALGYIALVMLWSLYNLAKAPLCLHCLLKKKKCALALTCD